MDLFQNILVATAFVVSVWYLFMRFFKPEKKAGKSCGIEKCNCK